MEIFSTLESIQTFLLQFGVWTPLAFFILQLLQIIVAPIPGGTVGLVGGALFGTFWGFVISIAGTLIGSCIVFLLAKRFGRPFVLKFVSSPIINKYEHIEESKLNAVLFPIFLILESAGYWFYRHQLVLNPGTHYSWVMPVFSLLKKFNRYLFVLYPLLCLYFLIFDPGIL